MNCPHCQKQMPEDHGASYCPLCGRGLPDETPSDIRPREPFAWRWFMLAILLPPVLTMLSAISMRLVFAPGSTNEGVSAAFGFLGGLLGGIVCGIFLGGYAGRNTLSRFLLSVLFSALFIPVCIVLCFFGCSMGGYNLRIGG